MKNLISKSINIVLNLIFPPVCCFCGKKLYPTVINKVCEDCANTLPYCLQYERCKSCGKPLYEGMECSDCENKKLYFTRATAAFLYTDDVKNAIIAFKKEDGADRADVLSMYMMQMVKYDFPAVEFDCVISVPPRKKKFSEEHFDQAGYLGLKTARQLGLPYFKNVLYQNKQVKKQSSLREDERQLNVKDIFSVNNPMRIKDKTILLTDDVCTTGATLNECAKVLKEAGAYCVYCVTAATVLAE